jgi:outer membrane protein TolC
MKILYLIPTSYFTKFRMSFILLLSALLFFGAAKGQAPNRVLADTSSAIEERLVELALKGPEMQNTAHLAKINEYQLKAAQNTWMNLLSFSVNYNDQTLAKPVPNTPYVYPKYFFGLTVPLGTIFSRTAVKSARENLEIGKNNAELLKRDIRERVLTAYKEYTAYSQLITIQSERVNDVNTQLAVIEEKFKTGKITLDAYNEAQKNNTIEMVSLVNLKLQRDLKRLELEKLIGVKLETVLKK